MNFRKISHFGPFLAKNTGQNFVKNVFFNDNFLKNTPNGTKLHQNERIDEFYINDEHINGFDVYILSRGQSKPQNIAKNGTKWSKTPKSAQIDQKSALFRLSHARKWVYIHV